MKAIYNSRIIDQEDIQISTNNRAFCYGDGLFETIVTGPNRINLVNNHIKRLKTDCVVLGLEFPKELANNLTTWIDQLSRLNGINGDIRTKVQVWRKEGGLYAPAQNNCEYIISVKKSSLPIYRIGKEIGFSKSVRNYPSIHSRIKSTNALNYVLAGIEKTKRDLDEIIILDNSENLSETHIGNLFWIRNNQVFTPSLETGCIAGIMRDFIIRHSTTQQVNVKYKELLDADAIFSTNASGIQYFEKLEDSQNEFLNPENYLKDVLKQIQQP